MSATSKRDRALLAGVEPVTGKNIHQGEEPPPEYLDLKPRKETAEAPPDPAEDT